MSVLILIYTYLEFIGVKNRYTIKKIESGHFEIRSTVIFFIRKDLWKSVVKFKKYLTVSIYAYNVFKPKTVKG
jgi:hypothetical protein